MMRPLWQPLCKSLVNDIENLGTRNQKQGRTLQVRPCFHFFLQAVTEP